jgi:hypothetical protein
MPLSASESVLSPSFFHQNHTVCSQFLIFVSVNDPNKQLDMHTLINRRKCKQIFIALGFLAVLSLSFTSHDNGLAAVSEASVSVKAEVGGNFFYTISLGWKQWVFPVKHSRMR